MLGSCCVSPLLPLSSPSPRCRLSGHQAQTSMASSQLLTPRVRFLPCVFPSSSRSSSPSCVLPRASSSSPPPALSSSTPLTSPLPQSSSSLLAIPVADINLELPSPCDIPLNALLPLAIAFSPVLLDTQQALAIEGQFGILEGRTASLIHPIVMGGLLVYTLWAGFLGWQWRRVRTIQDEINLLKKEVKPAEKDAPPSPTELKIKDLTETRKDLVKGGYRDRHFNAGSILLAFGVFEAVGGCLNTWFRTGKLFPGPHLFAGAGIAVLWALAAGLVPAMQKGNETARSLHIGLNSLNVILFLWQVPTGFEIVFKVLEFTSWP